MKPRKALIILPDIHGRDFWKVIHQCPDVPVIFLGDYLDPYPFEAPAVPGAAGVTADSAIDNFRDIVAAVRQRDNVTMLLGNHDLTYEIGKKVCECRTIYERYDECRKLFWDNSDLFTIAKRMDIGGKEFLFTHAGITPEFNRVMNSIPVVLGTLDDVLRKDEELNIDHKKHWDKFCRVLGMISHHRGGWDETGSMVWADICEHVGSSSDEKTDIVQVFGHTLCKEPIHTKNSSYEFYMLDSREPFYMDSKGEIRRWDDSVVELKTYKQ